MLRGWIRIPLGLFFVLAAGLPVLSEAGSQGFPKSRKVELWNGSVQLWLPKLAEDPELIGPKAYSIRPPADRPDLKYVIFVMREPLRADENKLSNQDLKDTLKVILQGVGYQEIEITHSDELNTFWADFRAVMESGVLPWQKVGPGIARGKAKFVRTGTELIGSVLLCDPSQWNEGTTQSFKQVVGGTSVTQ